jgi:uncharacterized protein (DUF58 family)
MLKSHFRGAGLQFKEHQIYNPGDDVRFIDWKLSAKTNTTFIKTFEEERNVEIFVMLDITETMFFGYKNISKLQAAVELICLLYLLADKSKDKVSVIIMGHELKTLPLCSGQEGIIVLISTLQSLGILNGEGKINLNYESAIEIKEERKFAILKSYVARKKEVVLFSDLSGFSDFEALNKLLYYPNLHCFLVESPLDRVKKLPFSVFGRSGGKEVFSKVNREEKAPLKGRYKKLNVDERYLEKFIREML